MKKIKTFADAWKALKIKATALPVVSALPEIHQKAVIAFYKLVIIAQALNEGWEPNWSNWDEWKYYPWFKIQADEQNSSGRGLSFFACYYDFSRTAVGSRLCYKTSDLAKYAGKQFEDLYKDFMLIPKNVKVQAKAKKTKK